MVYCSVSCIKKLVKGNLQSLVWAISYPRCSVKKGVLKNFGSFTEKQQCWSIFLNKVAEIKRLKHRCFPLKFAKSKRTLEEHLWTTASQSKLLCENIFSKYFCDLGMLFVLRITILCSSFESNFSKLKTAVFY